MIRPAKEDGLQPLTVGSLSRDGAEVWCIKRRHDWQIPCCQSQWVPLCQPKLQTMKKPSAYNPNREEVEEAVQRYLVNGGKIDNLQIKAKRSLKTEIEKTWAGETRNKTQP